MTRDAARRAPAHSARLGHRIKIIEPVVDPNARTVYAADAHGECYVMLVEADESSQAKVWWQTQSHILRGTAFGTKQFERA